MTKKTVFLTTLCISTLIGMFLSYETIAAEATIDSTANTTAASLKDMPKLVFISDTVGYIFYRDSGGTCVYKKTTDSGANWGSATNTTAQTDCILNAIWYDRWTPGDTTGTIIHMVFAETSTDDIYYDTFDTSGDSNGSEVAIDASAGNTYGTTDNIAITKGTDGDLYIGFCDGSAAAACNVKKCTSTCTTGTNWVQAGAATPLDVANDYIRMVPLASGNVMVVRDDISANSIQSRIYTDSSNSWAGSWTNIDTNAAENTTYRETIAVTIDRSTNDVYLAYGASVGGAGTADVKTALYSAGSWTTKTDVVTNQNTTTALDILFDEVNGDVYVAYLRGTLLTAMNAYYKKSTDNMTNWSGETQFNTTGLDLRSVYLNMMSDERVYGAYYQNGATNDGLFGDTIADLSSAVVSISVADGAVSYGNVVLSGSNDTTSGGVNDSQTVTNDGNVTVDLNVKGQNTSCVWTLSSSVGSDQYKHEFCTQGSGSPDPCDSSPTWTALTTNYQTLATSIAASGTKKFDLKLSTPSSTSCYTQQSVDVTVQAVQQ